MISTFIILHHVCLYPQPWASLSCRRLCEWAHTVSKVIDLKGVLNKYSDFKGCQEKPHRGPMKDLRKRKQIRLNRSQMKWNSLPQSCHCVYMFPAVCSLLVRMWVIGTGGEGAGCFCWLETWTVSSLWGGSCGLATVCEPRRRQGPLQTCSLVGF